MINNPEVQEQYRKSQDIFADVSRRPMILLPSIPGAQTGRTKGLSVIRGAESMLINYHDYHDLKGLEAKLSLLSGSLVSQRQTEAIDNRFETVFMYGDEDAETIARDHSIELVQPADFRNRVVVTYVKFFFDAQGSLEKQIDMMGAGKFIEGEVSTVDKTPFKRAARELPANDHDVESLKHAVGEIQQKLATKR